MAAVLVFHHALGLTSGVRDFAARLETVGHTVYTPDLFDGHLFDTLEAGLGYAQEAGFGEIMARGRRAAEELPDGLVYVGFSLGVMPAQMLTQTRPGARGAVLFEACVPPSEFGPEWPAGVPVQIHGMEADPIFSGEGDVDAARALVRDTPNAELFVYRGERHLFMDPTLPSYDKTAAELATRRALDLLAGVR